MELVHHETIIIFTIARVKVVRPLLSMKSVQTCMWFSRTRKILIPIHNILQLQNRALQSYMILQNTLVRATTTHCKETIIVVSKRNYLKREIIEWQSTWEACVICEWTCIDQSSIIARLHSVHTTCTECFI